MASIVCKKSFQVTPPFQVAPPDGTNNAIITFHYSWLSTRQKIISTCLAPSGASLPLIRSLFHPPDHYLSSHVSTIGLIRVTRQNIAVVRNLYLTIYHDKDYMPRICTRFLRHAMPLLLFIRNAFQNGLINGASPVHE